MTKVWILILFLNIMGKEHDPFPMALFYTHYDCERFYKEVLLDTTNYPDVKHECNEVDYPPKRD